jgi:hypothetical protein
MKCHRIVKMLQVNYYPLRLANTSLCIVFLDGVGPQKYTSGAQCTASQGNFTHNFKVILMLVSKNKWFLKLALCSP